MFTTSTRSLARWLVALPLLAVGSLMYWFLALGLGGISLMRLMALESDAPEMQVESSVEVGEGAPIMVHLQESVEPSDVVDVARPVDLVPSDNSGAGGNVTSDDQTTAVPGPGATSY